jgi:tetratricopeptide (TPR) repeat protein
VDEVMKGRATGAEALPFDVFVSLAGPDRQTVRPLIQALRSAGMQVFLDEESIPPHQAITAEIERALRDSRTLLAYYSRHFSDRPACQFELTAAFLAGQRAGDPTARIMVINPHEETDHLLPVELAEGRFERLPLAHNAATMARLVQRIRAKVANVEGCIGGVPFAHERRWYGRAAGTLTPFVGRYRELWALHSALHRHEFPLTQDTSAGGLAVVSGMPGIGKSELVAAYAWRFGAAHSGAVYWVSLGGSGTDPGEMRARLADAVRTIPRQSLGRRDMRGEEIVAAFADHVAASAEASLLIVDDIPGEVTAAVLEALHVPAGNRLYTVLITNRPAPDGPGQPVRVDAMSQADSVELLRSYRSGPADHVGALAMRLGGNPTALILAGRRLRDREGLLSYPELLAHLDRDSAALSPVTALLRDRIVGLDAAPRRLLYFSMICAPTALPVALIKRVLGGADADAAVTGLRDQLIARTLDTAWQIHALVRDAAREFLAAPNWAALAHDAATRILELTDTETDPATTSLLIQHGGHLTARADLPPATVDALLHKVVDHYDERGEPVLALPFHARLADRYPDDPTVLAGAAQSHQQAGAPDWAHRYAVRAEHVARDPALRRACQRWAAEALDALGRYADADPIWADLLAGAGATDRVDIELAHAHALRLRGQHAEARRRLEALATGIGDDPTLFHEAQAAQIEMALVELDTDRQVSARRRAYEVLSAYRERGMAHHRNAVVAGWVFADARLALSLWELRTDPSQWRNAARDLRELRDWYAATHGARNVLTLTTAVHHAMALVGLGHPGDARRAVEAVQEDLRDRLGEEHPIWLRACMVLGYAAAQCGRDDAARLHFHKAYEGQRQLYGQTHPDTLRAQLGLAIALKLTGDSATAGRMFAQVRRAAPASVGRQTDLYGQAFVASVLRPLPSVVWRLLAARHKSEEECL